jgi:hypothetical protein
MDVRSPDCAHLHRVDGVCVACADCLHEVVLNGACFHCGSTDIDVLASSPKPAADFVPAARLGKPRDGGR